MNLHDLIEAGTKPPRKGTRVRINDNAHNSAFRGAPARIGTYHVGLYTDDGEYITVTAKSVDIFPQKTECEQPPEKENHDVRKTTTQSQRPIRQRD